MAVVFRFMKLSVFREQSDRVLGCVLGRKGVEGGRLPWRSAMPTPILACDAQLAWVRLRP